MAHIKRKRLLVDSKVQGALALRVVFYWFMCLMTVSIMLLVWRLLTGPARMFYTHLDDMWFQFGPAVVGSLLLLPLVVIDVLRTSNRFVGPLYRMRADMRKLARGEQVRPIHFRDGDFWHEVAEEFNAMVAKLEHDRDAAQPVARSDYERSPVLADIEH